MSPALPLGSGFAAARSSVWQVHRRRRMREEAVSMLRSHCFFMGCPPDFLDTLARHCKRRVYEAEQERREQNLDGILLKEDDPSGAAGEFLYILERGSVLVEMDGAHVGELREGSVFGDAVPLGLAMRPLTTVSVGRDGCVVWRVAQNALEYVFKAFPAVPAILRQHSAEQAMTLTLERVCGLLFFCHCSQKFIAAINQLLEPKVCMPGTLVAEAGATVTAMTIVARGRVEILNEDGSLYWTVVAGTSAAAIGDYGLLGWRMKHSYTARTMTDCVLLELDKLAFERTLGKFLEEKRHYKEISAGRFESVRVIDADRWKVLDLFCGSEQGFLELLAKNAQRRLFFASQEIVGENQVLDQLLVLVTGTAEEVVDGVVVAEHRMNACIGAQHWLGLPKRTTFSVRAKRLCEVLVVERKLLLDGLRQFPDESTRLLSRNLRNTRSTRRGSGRASGQLPEFDAELYAAISGAEVSEPNSDSDDEETRASKSMPKYKSLRSQISRIPPFTSCHPRALDKIALGIQPASFEPGQIMLEEGEESAHMIIFLKGMVSVEMSGTEIDKVEAPSVFGEMAASHGANRPLRTATIRAITSCEVQLLPEEVYTSAFSKYSQDLSQFQKLKEIRAKQSADWMTSVSCDLVPDLQKLQVFRDADYDFIREMSQQLQQAIFLPDQIILKEGEESQSFFIIQRGTATIEKAGEQVQEITQGAAVGEMAILGITQPMPCTWRALTICQVRTLHTDDFMSLLQGHVKERARLREIAAQKLSASARDALEDYSFFQSFSKGFVNLLKPQCPLRLCFANEVLCTQGEVADSMFVLGKGSTVIVEVDGVKVKELHEGECFGTLALLSTKRLKRAGTVRCKTVCTVRALPRDAWMDALAHFPEQRQKLLEFTEVQTQKIEGARDKVMRSLAGRRIRRREREAVGKYQVRADLGNQHRRWCTLGFSSGSTSCTVSKRLSSMASTQEQSMFSSIVMPISAAPNTSVQSIPESHRNTAPRSPTITQGSTLTPAGFQPGLSLPDAMPERWECFNGDEICVPQTQLPCLNQLR